jgi:hypothetical protein
MILQKPRSLLRGHLQESAIGFPQPLLPHGRESFKLMISPLQPFPLLGRELLALSEVFQNHRSVLSVQFFASAAPEHKRCIGVDGGRNLLSRVSRGIPVRSWFNYRRSDHITSVFLFFKHSNAQKVPQKIILLADRNSALAQVSLGSGVTKDRRSRCEAKNYSSDYSSAVSWPWARAVAPGALAHGLDYRRIFHCCDLGRRIGKDICADWKMGRQKFLDAISHGSVGTREKNENINVAARHKSAGQEGAENNDFLYFRMRRKERGGILVDTSPDLGFIHGFYFDRTQ